MKKSLHKDQRGMGHAVVVILIVAVIAAIGVVGWRVMQKNNTVAKTPEQKAANSACLKVYHDKNLCNAEAASLNFDKLAYTAADTSVDAQGATSKFTMSSDGKGNSTVTMEGGGQSFSSVTIGNTSYTKSAGETTWTKYTSNAPTTDNPSKDLKTQFSDATTPADKLIQYKNLGKDKCGNVSCFKYQVVDPATPGTNYVWFSTKDYRLMRWYGKDANGTNDFVITYTSVTITAPSPVVDAASAGSAAAAASGMPTQAQIQAAEQAAAAAAAQSGQ